MSKGVNEHLLSVRDARNGRDVLDVRNVRGARNVRGVQKVRNGRDVGDGRATPRRGVCEQRRDVRSVRTVPTTNARRDGVYVSHAAACRPQNHAAMGNVAGSPIYIYI